MLRKLVVVIAGVSILASAALAGESLSPAPPSSRDKGAPAEVASTDSALEALLARMDAKARETKTLQADITVTNTENFSGRQSVRSGKIYVRKPSDLFLDLESPYPRKIWISSDAVTDYRPDLKTGDRVKLAAGAQRPQVIGLSTTADELRQSFNITLAPPNEKPKEYTLTLTPKENAKVDFTSAEVEIDAATLLPVSIVQKNKDLDETKTYTFVAVKVNPRLAESLFEPKFPRDADIQEHEGEGWKGP